MSDNRLRSILVCSLPAFVLSAACLLPYIDKAFAIDDTLYLIEARQILTRPLHPLAPYVCWSLDADCGAIAEAMPGNVLMSYYLTPVVDRPNSERWAHLLQIFALWCAIVATVSLAFGLGLDAFAACAAGLILVATPPVLAVTSTAMPEILTMSLTVIGLERLLAWKNNGKVINGVVSALAMGLAPIARSHLFLIWPVAALLLRDDAGIFDVRSWIQLPKRRWVPLIAGIVISVGAFVLTHEPRSGVKPPHMLLVLGNINHNFVSYFTEWIVAMPLGLAWLILRNRHLRFWLFPVFLSLPVLRKLFTHSPVRWTTFTMALGATVLIDVLLWSFRTRDPRRIACALWLFLPLVTLPYIHLPVKYLVPCAPAAALIVADILPPARWRVTALCGIVVAGTIFGSLILHTDYRLAEMGREAATRLVAPRVAAGHRVWFASQWGFYWYAMKAGGQLLRAEDVPVLGDYLVRGELEGWPQTLKRLPPAIPVETLSIGGPGGRTMTLTEGAGLYSNNNGNLMWVWRTGEWNHYEVWQF